MSSPAAAEPTPEQVLRRLDWQVVRRLDGLLQGDYRTLFYGAGVDFADLREYQAEDDARYIDWNVTARMHTLYVREYLEDRELTAWMLLDRSPSMAFGRDEHTKGHVLVDLVTTLSHLFTRRGNRVGAILYNNVVERTVPPGGGRRHVLRLVRELLNPPARTRTATDLNGLIQTGLNTIKRRSMVFLVSDFLSEPGWERPLSLLCRRHDVVAIRVWDPREVEFPDVGVMVLEDSETGEQVLVDSSDPVLRRRFAEAARSREERLAATLRRAGVDPFAISTEDDLVSALVRMAGQRKRRVR
ncbi:MAG: DUF58 domain-containing protein [Dehalococcoidia bacterium]|nr:MAG: DUF58 domain-containing protein [Dehalococcoidia bacterium]